ncbi:PTS glucitol/sorbitol transporter subunit IIA [Megasphaera vaginalis (ex Bordigoni et al. 2020)]|uniref:PTS glucitol/sorbitol transporter subunit IIA n=1 Tax=Megasphaera vaginalis (ex Bordigoni et al. 2020) TaxID=2045301 RepID=UPI000C7D0B15|nr:PTS glucitol/sorbitol transporter subunit IIA [Megasphaera vaginalis (ex Bordigoni et al. 2020)]
MKYYTEITTIGTEAWDLFTDQDTRSLILFGASAPTELAEISVLHRPAGLFAPIAVGDTAVIGDKAFSVTAVGSEAMHTLQELGHCTLCFKGGKVPERPGCIMLEGDERLLRADLAAGKTIEFY